MAKLRAIINSLAAVSVAQLVEHRSVAPRVVGSNPIAHPNRLPIPYIFTTIIVKTARDFVNSRAGIPRCDQFVTRRFGSAVFPPNPAP